MQQTCTQCQHPFVIDQSDLDFYDKVSPVIGGKKMQIPPPTQCPDCRQQRRAAQCNEIHLYKRKCDLTGKDIISNIHPSSPYKVYDQEVWYSDKWDPLEYGRDFDFSRPFFEQYLELSLAVPHMNLFTGYQYDENCDYTNYSGKNKNCYLIFDSDENRDCLYSYSLNGSRDCLDCFRVRGSELCHGCIDCQQCYSSSFLQDCVNCTDCLFLKNCTSCRNCLMSSNLVNREYVVENRQVTKEEFDRFVLALQSRSSINASQKHFEQRKLLYAQKYMHGWQNENVTGDYITQSKNVRHCFDGNQLWDCTNVYRAFLPVKDSMDCEAVGEGEQLYECGVCGYNANHLLFTSNCLDQISDLLYSTFCLHSSHLFGCNGVRRKKFCILNKQYSKEEYERLVPKIIAHMQSTKEWGEFFPVTLSPFSYNESTAFDHFPLTQEVATARGYQWRTDDEKEFLPQQYPIPDAIKDVADDISSHALACTSCRKNYKIIPQELAFYRSRGLPVPDQCFFCRHRSRKESRNPRKLWDRACATCRKPIQTSYAPDRKEKILCEECYLKEVY
ncbi:hypothetical protein EXS70_01490 [Candidatus Peribacteria bacterium]|nr:hypothetical protein [Candidatus Peribacteria bacterium]